MAVILSSAEIAHELLAYQVTLSAPALDQLKEYLHVLLRWNRRINLTGIREPRAIVRRLFGESLFLSRVVELQGWLVDVGSGAGFPGLALKVVAPELRVTLIEARRKKCTFLKEVVRTCAFAHVDVVAERFENWVKTRREAERADVVTTRAVDVYGQLLELLPRVLRPGGRLVLQTTVRLGERIRHSGMGVEWQESIASPVKESNAILIGTKT